jgi:hypothetical protein
MPYNRCQEWRIFAMRVEDHVRNYTVAQYGDSPGDEVESWTPEMCVAAIQKYTRRFSSGQRGQGDTLRDMLKIAHFACITYNKLGGKEVPLPVEKYNELGPGDYGYGDKSK